jgi:23S rRNA pseudouridine955/2504/2580 synthase
MLKEFTVSRNDSGQRVERYLRKQLAALSLDRIQSLFRKKEIKVARKPVKRGHLLQEGDTVQVYGLREDEAAVSAEAATAGAPWAARFDIPILFEDESILVVDKPANLAVHPGTGIEAGDSVIEKVRARLADERAWGEVFQPSLVHRLDKETSGVLLIAKTGESLRKLNEALREGKFTKQYLALVEGVPRPAQGRVDVSLQRIDSRSGGAKAEVNSEEGKSAATRYKTMKVIGNFSLLSVIIETGRMHQIRAHMAHIGHPILGDSRYGSHEKNRAYRKGLGLKRVFLHASDLEVILPASGKAERLAFHAPLAKDLSDALERLAAFTLESPQA